MKKLLLFAIALAAFGSANAQLSLSGTGKGYLRTPPKEFCYDGKTAIILDETEYGDTKAVYKVYNDNFEVTKTLTFDLGEAKYTDLYQRCKEEVSIASSEETLWSENATSWEQAKAWASSYLYDYTIEKDGYQMWSTNKNHYYKYDLFGEKYPKSYFYWNPKTYKSYIKYIEYKSSYINNDWYTYDTEEGSYNIEQMYYKYSDYDNNSSVERGFCASQTLFNNDDKYEILVPKFTQGEIVVEEYDYDDDGINDHRTLRSGMIETGVNVVSEDGNVIFSLESNISITYETNLCKINGKIYIIGYNGEEGCAFYEINRETSSIKKVAEKRGLRVSPTIANNSQDITIELGENSNAKEIIVVNAKGQTIKSIPVKAGQKQIKVNASTIGRGMNIVNARGMKGNNSCKIIVK